MLDKNNGEYTRESFVSMSMSSVQQSQLFEGGQQEDQKKTSNWSVASVNNIALTSYMLTVAHNNHDDFRFVLSPSPGSRSLDIVSYQQV